MGWNTVNQSYPRDLRGTLQQTDEGLLHINPTYRVGSRALDGTTNYTDLPVEGMIIRRFELSRITTGNAGIGVRWANRNWRAGQWTEVGSVYTDDTTDAQDPGADDFALETTTVNDGFVIIATRKFAWVSINVTTAGAATANTHTVRYSNFAGTGWTAVDAQSAYVDTFSNAADYATGEIRFVWAPPDDWGKVTSIGSVPAGFYALNVRATVVAGAAALAGTIEVGNMLGVRAIAANGIWEQEQVNFSDPWADALVAFFASSDGGDRVYAEVTTGV